MESSSNFIKAQLNFGYKLSTWIEDLSKPCENSLETFSITLLVH